MKCAQYVNKRVCNIELIHHKNQPHVFVKRAPHKIHIKRNDVSVLCGYFNEYVYEIIPSKDVVYKTASTNYCRNCLKTLLLNNYLP